MVSDKTFSVCKALFSPSFREGHANMMVCTIPIRTCTKNAICLIGNVQKQMNNLVYGAALQSPSSSCSYYNFINLSHSHYTSFGPSKAKKISPFNGYQEFQSNYVGFGRAKDKNTCISLTFTSMVTPRYYRKTRINFSTGCHDMNLRFLGPKQTITSKVKFNVGHVSWRQQCISAGLFVGLLVCFSTSERSYAEAPEGNEKEDDIDVSSACSSHGKKVLTKYSVIGIPGDGRCLFRSVAHGACIRSGKPAPNENLQRELADELRARVADEFVKRREETEWFIEGNFETYVSQMRKPHVWGGEPELLMASHVLQMPITVYMHDQESGGLISIAEYGQEYGKNNSIKVLYHGFGHYDALHITHEGCARPRL